ncbi:dihydrofolate reductase family protein [Brachybacterium paraconglomeratum]|uniref:dihydrofolate reductase family protein n=1 Tax=Brachybacterium paraconglomeratum TaxID=173362 RepID=UPI00223A9530|nr:dihydrofolate reductase family protein [Brachybacterium paraconglomeratum]MCT1437856.1 dihydrofolate reductase family protein [Brachybacterium paraconglomeratum]
MHLLLRDGAPLPSPVPVPADAEGARALAALYAAPQLPPGAVHVRAMMTTTIDGAVAGADRTSGSLHDPDDSFLFSVLRALADVVLVGASTVRAEDYRSVRGREDLLRPSLRPGGAPRPALAIWSRSGELPDYLDPDQPTYLLTPSAGAKDAARRSGLPAAQVLAADSAEEAVEALAARGMRLIQAEGGPSALARLAEAELLDELCFTTAHRTVGGPSPRVLDGAAHETRWTLESLLLGEGATLSRYRRA